MAKKIVSLEKENCNIEFCCSILESSIYEIDRYYGWFNSMNFKVTFVFYN
jgi:hypothetical protein